MSAAFPPPASAPVRTIPWLRPAIAVAAIFIAYRTSFVTLFDGMRLDTPLAHLAIVPGISLVLALVMRNADAGPPIHDRQLDWIIGLPLVLGALAVNVLLPARMSTEFWEWRLDLLSLPFFVAGVIALLFGVRTLWKLRWAVLFLFLAWPVPFNMVLDRWLGRFTDLTVAGLDSTLSVIPLATWVPQGDALFEVAHGTEPVRMSVASACSGANGLVGFLLVGLAAILVVGGRTWAKVAWLATGALLVWVLNIGRILVIFWAAKRWGEDVAIEGFHPYVGLLVFNLGVLCLALLMRPFGLHLRLPGRRPGVAEVPPPPAKRKPVPVAFATVLLVTAVVSMFVGQLTQFDRVLSSLGAPRLASFAVSRETPAGWQLSEVTTYDWSKRFFGESSKWTRYQYTKSSDTGELSASVPITVDVIETGDRAALSAYGVEACYSFHGYKISGRQSVDLGSGVVGYLLTWTNPKTELTWTTLYWHWPIKTESGTRYERVTLILNDQETNVFKAPERRTGGTRGVQLDLNDAIRGAGDGVNVDRLVQTRQFMTAFGGELVAARAAAPEQ